jgi:hypothetical protein
MQNRHSQCTGMGPLDLQWQLLMTFPGPIIFLAGAADALGWAHCICRSSCQFVLLGPNIFPRGAMPVALPMPLNSLNDTNVAQNISFALLVNTAV